MHHFDSTVHIASFSAIVYALKMTNARAKRLQKRRSSGHEESQDSQNFPDFTTLVEDFASEDDQRTEAASLEWNEYVETFSQEYDAFDFEKRVPMKLMQKILNVTEAILDTENVDALGSASKAISVAAQDEKLLAKDYKKIINKLKNPPGSGDKDGENEALIEAYASVFESAAGHVTDFDTIWPWFVQALESESLYHITLLQHLPVYLLATQIHEPHHWVQLLEFVRDMLSKLQKKMESEAENSAAVVERTKDFTPQLIEFAMENVPKSDSMPVATEIFKMCRKYIYALNRTTTVDDSDDESVCKDELEEAAKELFYACATAILENIDSASVEDGTKEFIDAEWDMLVRKSLNVLSNNQYFECSNDAEIVSFMFKILNSESYKNLSEQQYEQLGYTFYKHESVEIVQALSTGYPTSRKGVRAAFNKMLLLADNEELTESVLNLSQQVALMQPHLFSKKHIKFIDDHIVNGNDHILDWFTLLSKISKSKPKLTKGIGKEYYTACLRCDSEGLGQQWQFVNVILLCTALTCRKEASRVIALFDQGLSLNPSTSFTLHVLECMEELAHSFPVVVKERRHWIEVCSKKPELKKEALRVLDIVNNADTEGACIIL